MWGELGKLLQVRGDWYKVKAPPKKSAWFVLEMLPLPPSSPLGWWMGGVWSRFPELEWEGGACL